MTYLDLYTDSVQQLGPLQIWPLGWPGLSTESYELLSTPQTKFSQILEGEVSDNSRPHQVVNRTTTSMLIPNGWILSSDFHQIGFASYSELVPPMSTADVDLTHIQQPMPEPSLEIPVHRRAPISWRISGRSFVDTKNVLIHDQRTSGSISKNQFKPQKNIFKKVDLPRRLMHYSKGSIPNLDSNSLIRFSADQNAVIVSFGGEPLYLEVFSSTRAFSSMFKATVYSLIEDIDSLKFVPTSKNKIYKFVEAARVNHLTVVKSTLSSKRLIGGCASVETKAISDLSGALLHLTAINMNHRIHSDQHK